MSSNRVISWTASWFFGSRSDSTDNWHAVSTELLGVKILYVIEDVIIWSDHSLLSVGNAQLLVFNLSSVQIQGILIKDNSSHLIEA